MTCQPRLTCSAETTSADPMTDRPIMLPCPLAAGVTGAGERKVSQRADLRCG